MTKFESQRKLLLQRYNVNQIYVKKNVVKAELTMMGRLYVVTKYFMS